MFKTFVVDGESVTKQVGVIGWPVGHSRSPVMHNAAFAACGLDWHYQLLPTPLDQLPAVVGRIRSGELVGANVTIPHKQAVVPLLDTIEPAAVAIGAVNTIVRRGDQLVGDNTDGIGFEHALSEAGVDVAGKPCAVLGAGGAARAVVYVLRKLGASLAVYARDLTKAQTLVESGDQVYLLTDLGRIAQDTVLVVNTTPVGMVPNVAASPWPEGAPFPAGAFAFDLINSPPRTRWMELAGRAGARSMNGRAMLVYQGAAAFEKWTGRTAPIEVMRAALEAEEESES